MARTFNGTSDFVNVNGAHGFVNGTPYTVAFWVKASGNNGKVLWGEGNAGSSSPFFIIQGDTTSPNTKLIIAIKDDIGVARLTMTTSGTVLTNAWHHFAWTQDGTSPSTNVIAYIDGVQDSTSSYLNQTTTINTARIGDLRRAGSDILFFAGTMAHVATWSRTLAAHEVLTLASGAAPSVLAPTHYWPLWGADSPEPDLGVSTHVTGALTGTTAAAEGRVHNSLLVLT